MSEFLRRLGGITPPQVQKAGPAGANPAGGSSPSSPLLFGKAGVDKFEFSTAPLATSHSDVKSLVGNIAKMPLHEAKGQLNPSTVAGLNAAAKDAHFEFPPIGQ